MKINIDEEHIIYGNYKTFKKTRFESILLELRPVYIGSHTFHYIWIKINKDIYDKLKYKIGDQIIVKAKLEKYVSRKNNQKKIGIQCIDSISKFQVFFS